MIEDDGRLLLVENRRRNGSLDWSTPGGVVDPGEDDLGALTREVVEETGIRVGGWSSALYSVRVVAIDMQWTLDAVVHQALAHAGSIDIDDPDDIVTQAKWVARSEIAPLLLSAPVWLSEPLGGWLSATDVAAATTSMVADPALAPRYEYEVAGVDRASFEVRRTA